ncbi:hypothetical protein BDW60DRAFT_174231 [Aspergillus nidulans var. acristatus]
MNCIFSVTARRSFGLKSATVCLRNRRFLLQLRQVYRALQRLTGLRVHPHFTASGKLLAYPTCRSQQVSSMCSSCSCLHIPVCTDTMEFKILTYHAICFGDSVPGQRRMPAKSIDCLSFNGQAQTMRTVQRNSLRSSCMALHVMSGFEVLDDGFLVATCAGRHVFPTF